MMVRVMVSAINASGEPDFYFVRVQCSEEDYRDGHHYEAAKDKAQREGYDAFLAYDEVDSAGKAMLDLFVWDSASLIKI